MSEVAIVTTVPRDVALSFEQLRELDCSTVAATARRLIVAGLRAELTRRSDRHAAVI